MSLVWKLLRSHISVPQFSGFFFANVCGMVIVLLGIQFYYDVLPVFTQEDSFMKADYVVVSKRIGMGVTVGGQSSTFSDVEIEDLRSQSFIEKLCPFVSTQYKADAQMSINGQKLLSSELYFESVVDDFVDVKGDDWKWNEDCDEVPVIMPRSYINMYNFGYAQSHQLPKISEGLMGMIDLRILVRGNGLEQEFKGKVVGFSSTISSVLVPLSFMEWSNSRFASDGISSSTRLLAQVGNLADEQLSSYMEDKGFEMETDKLNQEKTTYFLRFVVMVVMIVGIVISALAFYILMLSIYLLVQKNAEKLETLLLIGYSPYKVALPYQMLTIVLNVIVFVLSLILIMLIRSKYITIIEALFVDYDIPSIIPSLIGGTALLLFVSILNVMIIRRKVLRIWYRK